MRRLSLILLCGGALFEGFQNGESSAQGDTFKFESKLNVVLIPVLKASRQQAPAAPVPPPKKARITSSVMLWTLQGTFDERLAIAADAGIQSVELVNEHEDWSDADAAKYKSMVNSYGMHMDSILASRDWVKRPVSLVNPAHRDAFLADVATLLRGRKSLMCRRLS